MKKDILGNFINTQKGYAFKSSDYKDKGTGIVRVSDFTDNSISENNIVYIDNELAKKYQQYKLNLDDVIIQTVGSWPTNPNSVVGKVVKVPSSISGYLLNQNAVKIIPNEELNLKYLYYLLKSQNFASYIISCARGAASQASITLEDIKNFEFNKPNFEVQIKIAKFLSNYDDLIENNNRRIKILEEMAQKIYKEWFVDFKFPGHEITTIKESVLSSIITPIKGKNITKSKAKIGNVPVVGGGIEPAYYHNVANTQAPVITISASGANAGFVNLYYKDIWASDCSYIDTTMTNYIYYIYLLLKNKQIGITNMQLGAAQPHVYPRDLVNLKIKEFPIEVVVNFEKMVSPIFENIKVLSIKNENLKQTRDILLPRLISGEIDVENTEII